MKSSSPNDFLVIIRSKMADNGRSSTAEALRIAREDLPKMWSEHKEHFAIAGFGSEMRRLKSSDKRSADGDIYQMHLPNMEKPYILPTAITYKDEDGSFVDKDSLDTTLKETMTSHEQVKRVNMEAVEEKYSIGMEAIRYALTLPGITENSTWRDVFSVLRDAKHG